MIDRVGVLTFSQSRSTTPNGSSRIRGEWLTRHWKNSELFRIGRQYGTVIFQKVYWLEYAQRFPGIKILDICDPDFLHWNSQCIAMANICDAVTTCTASLADVVGGYISKPTICVPDRIDFDSLPKARKQHRGNDRARSVAWYGYSVNYPSLDIAIPYLSECGIETLTVVSEKDRPYQLPAGHECNVELTNETWNDHTVYDHLLKADIILNFPLDYGRWKYKSNNKTIIAWALGLPVARSGKELRLLLEETARVKESDLRYEEVRRDYDIAQSVLEYKELIYSLHRMNGRL